jgi:chromosomal replication initiator protein
MDTDNKQLWENVLAEIELNISKANFSTWFKDTYIGKFEDGTIFLSVPNEFVRDWLSNKYHKMILKILRGFSEGIRGVEYLVKRNDRKREESEQQVSQPITLNHELPLGDYYINKNDNLNPRYTFETFVIGTFNELAHAAAQAVIQKPGIAYNPLFLYGKTGHGKTHLIQAIGNHIKKANPSKKIYYVTSEKFTIDYMNAVQSTKVNAFKEKYRQYDVLIMDDIQFFSNKEKTQEELFHLFNALYDNNKQIVFSSDKHPNYIQNLEERLKSRFAAGMIVDIPEPDHESRLAIFRAKALQSNLFVPEDILDFLASSIQGTNIRDIEGLVNSLSCQSQLKGRMLSINEIKGLIKESSKPKRNVSTQEVIRRVAEFYDIDESSIYEKTRRKEVVKPRQMIMYILRNDFNISFPSIGQKLGGRDHTTVIHSCEKVKRDLEQSDSLERELEQIRNILVN